MAQTIRSLDEFLKKHKTKEGETATNTRIPNVKLNVYPGSYCIPEEKRKQFYKLYNKKVFQKKRAEHLTEIQNKEKGGPILIDLDFRFPEEVEDRAFEDDLIYDLLSDDERDYYKINEAYKKYISQYSKEYIELSEYYYGPELPYSIYCREFKKYNGTYLDSSKDINELYALFLFFAMYHYTLSEVTGVAKK